MKKVSLLLVVLLLAGGLSSLHAQSPDRTTFGIYANPAGFLLFGPIFGLEMIRNNFDADVHVRLPSLGLLMPYLDEIEANHTNSVSGGVGVGFGANYFTNGPDGGLYVGGMIEYWTTRFEHKASSSSSWDWYADATGLVIGANLGYKWLFSSGLFLNLGGYLGASVGLDYDWRYKSHPGGKKSDGDTYFFGMVDLAIGVNFVNNVR